MRAGPKEALDDGDIPQRGDPKVRGRYQGRSRGEFGQPDRRVEPMQKNDGDVMLLNLALRHRFGLFEGQRYRNRGNGLGNPWYRLYSSNSFSPFLNCWKKATVWPRNVAPTAVKTRGFSTLDHHSPATGKRGRCGGNWASTRSTCSFFPR